eukprot:NODE_18_length_40692_cov_0.469183.p25 type:complete len:101 gc:universal NODE_18_length_40692_cov_0.469183:371-69(-)
MPIVRKFYRWRESEKDKKETTLSIIGLLFIGTGILSPFNTLQIYHSVQFYRIRICEMKRTQFVRVATIQKQYDVSNTCSCKRYERIQSLRQLSAMRSPRP